MLLIDCPWCGTRSEEEFSCGGQAHIARPPEPAAASDQAWGDYLYERVNPKGVHFEMWRHTFGCRQWFNIARDTITDEIRAVYKATDPRPELEG